MWRLTLDRTVDEAAQHGSASAPARLAAILLTSGVLAVNVGVSTAAPWLVISLIVEIWERLAARGVRRGTEGTQLSRLNYLATVAAMTLTWSAAPAILWMTGSEALRIVAIAILTGQLIHAQAFGHKSLPVLLADAGIPSLTLLVLPTLMGGFHGVAQATIVLSVMTVIGYTVSSARANAHAYNQLLEARSVADSANQAKSAFLAMISHELRTPLNGILGMAQALKLSRLDDQQHKLTHTLIECGDDLLVLLNDVLDLSKIEAGKMEVDLKPLEIRAVAAATLDLWSPTAEEKGVRLVLAIADDVPTCLLGDALRLKQILLNLVSNALKFTSEGEVRLSIRSSSPIDDAVCIEIEVRDTGIGMSQSQQEGLFQDYVQANISTSGSYGGTGLGLSICRRLCELMSADISVRSASREGSTFLVRLPMPIARLDNVDPTESPTVLGLAGCRVLVVDDNPNNRAVAQAILGAMDAAVETAATAIEAMDSLRWGSFDLVLTDLHMPEMDGMELARRIRRGEAGPADIPIVALTGDLGFKSNDFDAVHPKPIQATSLVASLARLRRTPVRKESANERASA